MKMATIKKYNNHLKNINEFSTNLGIAKEDQIVLEINSTQKEDEKILKLKNGSFKDSKPWFIIDEEGEVQTLISLKTLKNLLESLKQSQRENFELRLEKALHQQVPIDFNDVWVVAMDAIKRKREEGFMEAHLDLTKLVAELKEAYPNLFVDMHSIVQRIRDNERL